MSFVLRMVGFVVEVFTYYYVILILLFRVSSGDDLSSMGSVFLEIRMNTWTQGLPDIIHHPRSTRPSIYSDLIRTEICAGGYESLIESMPVLLPSNEE